jgi:hypothetical protein
MNLKKTLHILAHGKDFPPSFIDQAKTLLATLTGEDASTLAAALSAVESQAETTTAANTKGK